MFDAAIKALSQMMSPPLRAILWKAIGLSLALIVTGGVLLQRLLAWLAGSGEAWMATALGPDYHGAVTIVTWMVSILAGLGVVLGAVFLMPTITSLVASFFVDDIADHIERESYPAERVGSPLPFNAAIIEGVRAALLTLVAYVVALPFVLFAGAGLLVFFIATAWLLGLQYFELAAMRFRSPAEAKAMRRHHAGTVFVAGLFIAAFVSIPIVNLATPLFGMAFMVHMHKRLSGPGAELIEPTRSKKLPVA
jgi:uncharacterized protein involved in cysteine biosynthesis